MTALQLLKCDRPIYCRTFCSFISSLVGKSWLLPTTGMDYLDVQDFGTKLKFENFDLRSNSLDLDSRSRSIASTWTRMPLIFDFDWRFFHLGLWHFWVYLVGSPWDANFFEFEFKLVQKKGKEELSYR